MSTTTEGWVVIVGSKQKGGVHKSRQAGRDYAKSKGLQGFKVVKAADAPKTTRHARATKRAGDGGYVPAVRRKCADCGHYRKREEQTLVAREVTFERGGKTITQTRNVAVCAGGCRDNVR